MIEALEEFKRNGYADPEAQAGALEQEADRSEGIMIDEDEKKKLDDEMIAIAVLIIIVFAITLAIAL